MSLATLLEAARFIEQLDEHQDLTPHLPPSVVVKEEEPECTPLVLSTPRSNGFVIQQHPAQAVQQQVTLAQSVQPTQQFQHLQQPILQRSLLPAASAPITIPAHHQALLVDHASDPPRARSDSNGSGGPRAGTREVHNKLEKNRRAHLKDCFELLKRQLPGSPDDKKSSNLSILDSAIRYIQVLKRRERECEHEMERLAREKIASQQRLAALRRDSPSCLIPRVHHATNHDRDNCSEGEETLSSRISPLLLASPGSNASISLSLNSSSELMGGGSPITRLSPPATAATSLDLSTRTARIFNTSTHAQVLNLHSHNGSATIHPRTPPSPPNCSPNGSHHQAPRSQIITAFAHQPANNRIPTNGLIATPGTLNLSVAPAKALIRAQKTNLPTLTVTTVNHGQVMAVNHGQGQERKMITPVSTSINGQTALVHPTQLHLTQMMNGNSVVVSPAIQLFSSPHTIRVIQGQGGALAPIDLPSTAANSPIQKIREVNSGAIGSGLGRSGAEIPRHHHHIAIKPQPGTTLHSMNSKSGIHMMNGLTPLVVSQGGTHIITTSPHLTGKVMTGPLIKTGQQIPLSVNAQYLGATTLVKPVVVVSTGNGLNPPSTGS